MAEQSSFVHFACSFISGKAIGSIAFLLNQVTTDGKALDIACMTFWL